MVVLVALGVMALVLVLGVGLVQAGDGRRAGLDVEVDDEAPESTFVHVGVDRGPFGMPMRVPAERRHAIGGGPANTPVAAEPPARAHGTSADTHPGASRPRRATGGAAPRPRRPVRPPASRPAGSSPPTSTTPAPPSRPPQPAPTPLPTPPHTPTPTVTPTPAPIPGGTGGGSAGPAAAVELPPPAAPAVPGVPSVDDVGVGVGRAASSGDSLLG